MNPESFKQYVDTLRSGCINRIDHTEEISGYYMDSYNELTGILMSVNAEYYNTDE